MVAQLLEWPGRRGKVLLVRPRTKTTEPLPAHDGSFPPPSPKRPIPVIHISTFFASAFSSNSFSESLTLDSRRIPKCLLLLTFSCCLVLPSSGIECYSFQAPWFLSVLHLVLRALTCSYIWWHPRHASCLLRSVASHLSPGEESRVSLDVSSPRIHSVEPSSWNMLHTKGGFSESGGNRP